jgi:hypothetical protein
VIVQLPPAPHLAAASLTGLTRRDTDPGSVLRGAVVVKAAFDLETRPGAAPGAPRAAVPRRAATAIEYADDGSKIVDPDERDLEKKEQGIGFDLRYEADTALEKLWTDIVVAGWMQEEYGGCVRVNGVVWRKRQSGLPAERDTERNLFGWLSKTEAPRCLKKSGDSVKGELPTNYDPGFSNFSRRGHGFSSAGDHHKAPLPSYGTVAIFATYAGRGDPSYAFILPDLALTARLRAYCGHGYDRAAYWRIVGTVPLRADTLIVYPDQDRATVLWRASWDHDLVAPETWRLVQILPGGH